MNKMFNFNEMPYKGSGRAGGKSVSWIGMLVLLAGLLILPSSCTDTEYRDREVTKYVCQDADKTEVDDPLNCPAPPGPTTIHKYVCQDADKTEVDDPSDCPEMYETVDRETSANNRYTGGSKDERIAGTDARNDFIDGRGGDDVIKGMGGNDDIHGGDGDDMVSGNDGDDTLHGNDGDDTLMGGAGDDTLAGDEGDDHLDGGADEDVAKYIMAAAERWVADVIADLTGKTDGNDGFNGRDTFDAVENLHCVVPEDDTITTPDSVTFIGDGENNHLVGCDGDDTLRGGAGNDTLEGKGGADTLEGGADDDTLIGGAGGDTLDGGAGSNDTASYAGSVDTSDSPEPAAVTVSLAAGATAPSGGHADGDMIKMSTIDPLDHDGDSTTAAITMVSTIENLTGGPGNDTLTGDHQDNTLKGGDGTDSLTGGPGNDMLYGEGGTDTTLAGGAGDDTYMGVIQDENDNVTEDPMEGTDTLYYEGVADDPKTTDTDESKGIGASGSSIGTPANVEMVFGTQNADYLTAAPGATVLGLGGKDVLVGNSDDTADVVETLVGCAGENMLTGAAGNDVFGVYNDGANADAITEFTTGAGTATTDEIHLKGFEEAATAEPRLIPGDSTHAGIYVGDVLVATVASTSITAIADNPDTDETETNWKSQAQAIVDALSKDGAVQVVTFDPDKCMSNSELADGF